MELNNNIAIMAVALGLVALALGLAWIPVRLKILLASDVKQFKIKYWKMTIVDSDRSSKVSYRKKTIEPTPRKNEPVKEKLNSPSPSPSERFSQAMSYINIAPKIAKPLLGFVIRFVKKLKLQDVQGSVSGGLENPADTGIAFGALYAILGATPALRSHLKVKPDYTAERIEYDFQGEILLRPVALLGPTLKLLQELPKRDLLKIIRNRRKSRKDIENRKRQEVENGQSSS